MSEVQQDPEDVFAEKGKKIYIYKVLIKFSCNFFYRSKLARSTLTSPGPIRVKLPDLKLLTVHRCDFLSRVQFLICTVYFAPEIFGDCTRAGATHCRINRTW